MPLTPRESGFLEGLDRQAGPLESFLEILTRINSFSGNKDGVNRVGDLLSERLAGVGFRVAELVSGKGGRTLVARRKGDTSHRLLLLGHLDTVYPPGTFENYVRAAATDDLATGPGVADMKGGLVIIVAALEALHLAGALDQRHVTVILNADEEIGSPSSADLIRAEATEAELCLGFEPGRTRDDGRTTFVTARRGFGKMRLEVKGRSAHAGIDPQSGANAIVELAHKAVALHALNDAEAGVSVNVGTFRGGTAANTVPDEATAEIDYRFPDEEAGTEVEDAIAAIAGRVHLEGSAAGAIRSRLLDPIKRPAMVRSDAAGRMAARLLAYAADLGIPLVEESRGGSSDAAFAAEVGCPSVCGLGAVGGGFHTEEEWVRPSSLVARARLLALTMTRFFDL